MEKWRQLAALFKDIGKNDMNKKQIHRVQFELVIEFQPRKVVFFFLKGILEIQFDPFSFESLEPVEI